jgi:hypothetical protein
MKTFCIIRKDLLNQEAGVPVGDKYYCNSSPIEYRWLDKVEQIFQVFVNGEWKRSSPIHFDFPDFIYPSDISDQDVEDYAQLNELNIETEQNFKDAREELFNERYREPITEPEETVDERNLLEALADIAYIAGAEKFYGGDSRADISNFITWAKEFHKLHQNTNWDEIDYIETITEFAMAKIVDAELNK